MSRLAAEYLSSFSCFPRRIENIESDLSNGYLLISLLNYMGHVTEEDYEQATDDLEPSIVLSNFGILARSLRKLDIGLTKKEVASIISETPGASASLVMGIRRSYESKDSGKYSNADDAYKSIISSTRPKEYKRTDPREKDNISPKETFYSNARTVLDNGVFSEIDMRCHLGKYEKHQYSTDAKSLIQVKNQQNDNLQSRQLAHDKTSQKREQTQRMNSEKDGNITTRWSSTQEDKKKRQVRDLQFELATLKINELRHKNRSSRLKKDQEIGIDAFETNLKRSGISGNDDGQPLSTTYEDAELFINRLEQTAGKSWPSDDDTNDFMMQLKGRTKESRIARYEKARRRRRMLVEQANSTQNLSTDSMLLESDEKVFEEKNEKELSLKKSLKLEKHTHSEDAKNFTENHERILNAAEESIKEFSAEFESKSEEITAMRKEQLKAIAQERAVKMAKKHDDNNELCKSLVKNLLNEILDGKNGNDNSSASASVNYTEPSSVLNYMQELAESRVIEGDGKSSDVIRFVTSMDSWMSFAALSMNIGKWDIVLEETNLTYAEQLNVSTLDSNDNSDQSIKKENDEEILKESSSIEEEKDPIQSEIVEIVGENETKIEEIISNKRTQRLRRTESYLETTQTVLETIIERFSNDGAEVNVPLDLNDNSKNIVGALENKVLVVLSNGFSSSLESWSNITKWVGNENVSMLDTFSVIKISIRLKPLLEGKKPSINFASLVHIFSDGKVQCPPSLENTHLEPELLRTVTEIVENADKILSMKEKFDTNSGKALPKSELLFTDCTCGIIIGQSIWIQREIRSKFTNLDQSIQSEIDRAMPSSIVVSRYFGNYYSTDDPIFARVVEWFLQGGTRDDIPEEETDLFQLVKNEGGGGKGGGKKPAKGKGGEPALKVKESLSGIVWITNKELKYNTTPDFISNLEKSTFTDSTDKFSDEVVRYILDSSDASKYISDSETVQTDSYNFTDAENYILNYDTKPLVQDGNTENATIVEKVKVPIYFIQSTSSQSSEELDVISNSENNGSEVKEERVSMVSEEKNDILPPNYIYVSGEFGVSETILSIIADIHNIYHDGQKASESLANNANDKLDHVQECSKRIKFINEYRRSELSAEDQVWLYHLSGVYPLNVNEVYATYEKVCAAQSCEIELKGLSLMVISHALLKLNNQLDLEEATFLHALKSTDKRWYNYCADTIEEIDNTQLLNTKVLYDDLICRIGNVIDDRHMIWLSEISEIQSNSSLLLAELQKNLIGALDLYLKSTFVILESQKEVAYKVSDLFCTAGYIELPWLKKSSKQEPEVKFELDSSIKNIYLALGKNGISNEDESYSAWKDLIEMELPLMDEGNSSIIANELNEFHKDSISSATNVITCVLDSFSNSKEKVGRIITSIQKYTRKRHEYEHNMLRDWGNQLKSKESESDSPVGKKFLSQFYFGVSDDVLQDGIPFKNGNNMIEFGDFHLELSVLNTLSEEINLLLIDFKIEAHEEYNTTIVNPNVSSGDMSANDVFATITEEVSNIFVTAIKTIIQKNSNISIPKGWRNNTRVQNLIKDYISSTQFDDISEGIKAVSREIIISMAYASIPIPLKLDYIDKVIRLICPVSNNDSTMLSLSDTIKYDVPSLIDKILGDPKLSIGWWNSVEKVEQKDSLNEIKESVKHFFSSIAFCCFDINDKQKVDLQQFSLAICKSPSTHLYKSFESSLIFKDKVNTDDVNAFIINDGLYKAITVSSKFVFDDYSTSALNIDPNESINKCQGIVNISSLCGGNLVSKSQLNWLRSACSISSNGMLHSETWNDKAFRAHIGICPFIPKAESQIEIENGATANMEEGETKESLDPNQEEKDEETHEIKVETEDNTNDVHVAEAPLPTWKPAAYFTKGLRTYPCLVGFDFSQQMSIEKKFSIKRNFL